MKLILQLVTITKTTTIIVTLLLLLLLLLILLGLNFLNPILQALESSENFESNNNNNDNDSESEFSNTLFIFKQRLRVVEEFYKIGCYCY